MGVVGQVSFFVALILVIVIHEAAHYGVARAFGIKVTEFFVGFGPKLWSTRRGETEVGIKAIPAGGYVKIAGMNPFEDVAPALVIVAGPATHFVLAFVCFALWLGFVGEPTNRSPVLDFVAPTLDGRVSPAEAAGLRAGDRIVEVDGVADPSRARLIEITQERLGEVMSLVVERDGERFTVELVPVPSEVDGVAQARIGVLLGEGRRETSGVAAIADGADLVVDNVVSTVKAIGRVFGPEGIGRIIDLAFTDEPRRNTDPASVVGITRVAGNIGSGNTGTFWDILLLFGVVNVFVGVLNLLPLPPFDGGHVAVLAIERIRGRPIDMRKIIPVSAAVAAFFIVFTLAVVYVDIVKPPV
jgi:membrane-associated protease RseP (regulator of RpoE activity)